MTSLHSGSDYIRDVRLGTVQASAVYLGTTKIWPPMEPELTTYSAAGSYTYTIPSGSDKIDVVLLGGGEGGTGITWGNGQGGQAGNWSTTTLTRGVDISWATTTISGSVGAGGSGNGGAAGGDTTATVSGGSTYTATGGTGGMGVTVPGGEAAGTQVFNGQSYVGGGSQGSLGNAGKAPGGGGAGGGFGASIGGNGAAGSAWFYAYSASPEPFPATPPGATSVAYDATGTGGLGTGSSSSMTATGTHTCNGNAVVVAVNVSAFGVAITSCTVTYGGQAMTQLGVAFAGGANYAPVYLFGLLDPPAGSQTVSATATSSGLLAMVMGSVSYSDVTSFGSVSSATGSSTSPAQTVSSASGDMVAQAFGCFGNYTMSAYNQTQRLANGGSYGYVCQGDVAGAASVNFSATLSGSAPWAGIAVPLNA